MLKNFFALFYPEMKKNIERLRKMGELEKYGHEKNRGKRP